jgi:hypothetical protein
MSALEAFDFHIATDEFYKKLFELAPHVEALFTDKINQQTMFINALQSVDDFYGNDAQLKKFLSMLGKNIVKSA